MENVGAKDLVSLLIRKLTHGKELTKQLETHIEQGSPPELCKPLVESLLRIFDKAISMARSSSESDGERRGRGGPSGAGTDSPRSMSGSPRSEGSDRGFKDKESRELCKKRKPLPKWTRRVSEGSETGLEGPLDDGFNWRKYGQKEILGAKYPRGYYRCTYRHSRGCPATKQVQRSDENPSVFDIIYRGNHTCVQRDSSAAEAPSAAAELQRQWRQSRPVSDQPYNEGGAASVEPLLLSFRTGLTVKTEDLDKSDPFASSSFSFPSPAAATLDGPFSGGFSPPYISPVTTSESSYFSASPCQVGGLTGGQNLQGPESGLEEMFFGASSNSSTAVDWGFMLDSVESNRNFSFDSSFFS